MRFLAVWPVFFFAGTTTRLEPVEWQTARVVPIQRTPLRREMNPLGSLTLTATRPLVEQAGPYGAEGFIRQALAPVRDDPAAGELARRLEVELGEAARLSPRPRWYRTGGAAGW